MTKEKNFKTSLLYLFCITIILFAKNMHPILAEQNQTNESRIVEHTTLELNILLYNENLKALPGQKITLIEILEDGNYKVISEKSSDFKGKVTFNQNDQLSFQVQYGLLINNKLQPVTFSTDTPTSWYETILIDNELIDTSQLNLNNLDDAILPDKDIFIQIIDNDFKPIANQLIKIGNDQLTLEKETNDKGVVSFHLEKDLKIQEDVFQIYFNNEEIPYQIIPSTHMRIIVNSNWPIVSHQEEQHYIQNNNIKKDLSKETIHTKKTKKENHTLDKNNELSPYNTQDEETNQNETQTTIEKNNLTNNNQEDDVSDNELIEIEAQNNDDESFDSSINHEISKSTQGSTKKPIKNQGSTFNRMLPQTGEQIINWAIIGTLLLTIGSVLYLKSIRRNNKHLND